MWRVTVFNNDGTVDFIKRCRTIESAQSFASAYRSLRWPYELSYVVEAFEIVRNA